MGTNFFLVKFEKVENRKSAIKPIKISNLEFSKRCALLIDLKNFLVKQDSKNAHLGTHFFLGKFEKVKNRTFLIKLENGSNHKL